MRHSLLIISKRNNHRDSKMLESINSNRKKSFLATWHYLGTVGIVIFQGEIFKPG